jgi:hypothetical protein
MSAWQLSWNHKKYDFEGRLKAAAASDDSKYLMQSWGRSPTKNISKIKEGDTLYISCKKKCVAKAVVTQAFAEFELDQVEFDGFSRNRLEPVATKQWYCQIRITEIYFDEHRRELMGNQNTLCDPKNAFWKN